MDNEIQKRLELFARSKNQCLSKEDLSRKGNIDEPIKNLVEVLNSNRFYYTTSTCSGRISLIVKPQNNPAIKKGREFLLNSHQEVEFQSFYDLVQSFAKKNDAESCLWLKFEPFIMHVQCFDLERARSLVNFAIQSGCRNSGITIGKGAKFLVAVRSTSFMEVPLCCGSRFSLDSSYPRFLVDECNRRLNENLMKLEKFTTSIGLIIRSSDSGDGLK